VRGAHHDALDDRLPADEGFLTAFEDGQHLNMREKTNEGAQGHNSSLSERFYYNGFLAGGLRRRVRRLLAICFLVAMESSFFDERSQ
jgi:hypothetical protein